MEDKKYAILVIDVQNDFCAGDGVFSKKGIMDVSNIQKNIESINKVIKKGKKQEF